MGNARVVMIKKLDELYSTAQAAAYLSVSYGTWKNHVFVKGYVTPMLKGKTAVFTRRMLDAYANGRRNVKPTTKEEAEVYDSNEAADYCDMELPAFKHHAFTGGNVRSVKVGHARLYIRADLDAFLAEKRGAGRPSSKGD